MSKVNKNFLKLDTSATGIQASVIPANTTPANYTQSTTDIKGNLQGIDTALGNKVEKNAAITPGTNLKITYDAKGLVTSSSTAELNDLNDVLTSAPAVNDHLVWNGTEWTNGAQVVGAGNGVSLYLDDTASDISGYFTLNQTPTGGTEVVDTVAVTSGTSPVLIESYATPVTGLNRTSIDGGTWVFNTFGSVSSIAGSICTIRHDVYKRTSGGTETLLFSVDTPALATTVGQYDVETVQPAFACNLTDRLVIKYSATNNTALSRNVTLYHNGTTHYSHIHTPLIQSHNDLAGLQGGSGNERYHLSAAQHTVATQAATNALDGYLSATDHTTFAAKEPALGNPSVTGYVLTSTTGGVRSWVAQSGGGGALDIAETSYIKTSGVASALTNENITGFAFLESAVRAFEGLLYVTIVSSQTYFQVYKITGIQRNSSNWMIDATSTGDNTGINLDISSVSSSGQLIYSIAADGSRTAINMKFRAQALSI